MLADLLGFFLLFGVLSIVLHEWAHVEYFRRHGRNVSLRWHKGCLVVGKPKDYKNLTKKQLRGVYTSGIYMGLIPIIMGSFLFSQLYWLLLLPYIAWSWPDIKNAWRYK